MGSTLDLPHPPGDSRGWGELEVVLVPGGLFPVHLILVLSSELHSVDSEPHLKAAHNPECFSPAPRLRLLDFYLKTPSHQPLPCIADFAKVWDRAQRLFTSLTGSLSLAILSLTSGFLRPEPGPRHCAACSRPLLAGSTQCSRGNSNTPSPDGLP